MDILIKENAMLDRKRHQIDEQIAGRLYDMAEQLYPKGSSPASLLEIGTARTYRALIDQIEQDEGVMDENKRLVYHTDLCVGLARSAQLCRLLAEKSRLSGDSDLLLRLLTDRGEEERGASENRAIYLKNPYADRAFLQFSQRIDGLCADYAQNFTQVCEAVSDGGVKFGILPLENNTAGTVASFRSLMQRYRLCIVASCDVATGEGEITRFALICATLLPTYRLMQGEGTRYFRFSLPPIERGRVWQIVALGQMLGQELYKIDSIPLSYADNEFSYELTFLAGDDLAAFLICLSLEETGFEIVGYYRQLS